MHHVLEEIYLFIKGGNPVVVGLSLCVHDCPLAFHKKEFVVQDRSVTIPFYQINTVQNAVLGLAFFVLVIS